MHDTIHRRRCRGRRLSLLLGIGALVAASVPASGGAGTPTPTCHGRPATFVGTPGNDNRGHRNVNDGDVFVLLGGRDVVYDDAKNVTVCGGSDRDVIYATEQANGRRTLFDGGRGDDYLIGRWNTQDPLHLFGGKGRDQLTGSQRDDTIKGGDGNDRVWGMKGDDVIRGGRGKDKLQGRHGKDRLYGNGGRDALFGGSEGRSDRTRDLADGGRNNDKCRAEVKRRCER